jgi:iron complex outermembrane receptor protein
MAHTHVSTAVLVSFSLARFTLIAAAEEAAPALPPAAQTPAPSSGQLEEVVVSARKRAERLISTPVVVSAFTEKDLSRYNSDDLTKIGEMTPTVIIGTYKANGGGSLAIRGISSPANQSGFEQAVSVAIDGVQTSDGRIAQVGMFDLQQVEVLKGPQALFFGKNSPAGVIAVTTAGPTPDLQITGKTGYEFIADEVISELTVSGPLSDHAGGRLALRYRNMDGWLRNDAGPIANPFYKAATGAPAGAAQLPGAADHRPGEEEYMGRATLTFDPSQRVTAKLKVFGAHSTDAGDGVAAQNIGPCSGPHPRMYGVADPYGECTPDNRVTVGDEPSAIASTYHLINTDGRASGVLDAWTSSLALDSQFGQFNLASLTGYNYLNYGSFSGLDQTTYSQLAQFERNKSRAVSQEIRLSSRFNSPLNFVLGGYYQNTRLDVDLETKLNDGNYNAVANRFVAFQKHAGQPGSTLSGFGQLLYAVTDEIELAGGARWTHERKHMSQANSYGVGAFDTLATVYAGSAQPGTLQGTFDDNNVSPEATVTWRPTNNRTVFLAYKTGFKSGGFGLTNPLQKTTQIGDVNFESEKVKGFELGAKGQFLDNRLRLSSAVFTYNFDNLQVNTYNPAAIAYTINNAGKVRQRGAELEASYRATRILTLDIATAYVHNRFEGFTGQCYGYLFPTGTVRASAAPPPNCSFVNATTLTLQQVFDGRAPARSPDESANAGFVFDIPFNNYRLGLSGTAIYSSKYYAAETMAPATLQPAFWRFNASASVSGANEGWSVSLIGRNLSNRYYLLYAADRTGGTSVPGAIGEQRGVVARGREVALQGAFKF